MYVFFLGLKIFCSFCVWRVPRIIWNGSGWLMSFVYSLRNIFSSPDMHSLNYSWFSGYWLLKVNGLCGGVTWLSLIVAFAPKWVLSMMKLPNRCSSENLFIYEKAYGMPNAAGRLKSHRHLCARWFRCRNASGFDGASFLAPTSLECVYTWWLGSGLCCFVLVEIACLRRII